MKDMFEQIMHNLSGGRADCFFYKSDLDEMKLLITKLSIVD